MEFINLKNPKQRIDENLFISKIAQDLNYSKKEKYLLIIDSSVGKKDLLQNLVKFTRKENPYLNVAHLNLENNKVHGFPFFVKNILEDINNFKTSWQLAWNAINFFEKLFFLIVCLVVLVIFQSTSTLIAVLFAGEIYSLKIQDFIEIQSLLSYILSTALALFFPVLSIYIFRLIIKSPYREVIQNKASSKTLEILKADKYKVTLKLFYKKYFNNYGPAIIIIDSIDDYYDKFDYEFSEKLTEELEKLDSAICTIFVSTFLTKTREELLNNYKELHFYKVTHSVDNNIKSSSPLNDPIREHELSQLFEPYSVDRWNAKTIFQLLSASHYFSLYGFKPSNVEAILELSYDDLKEFFKIAKYDDSLIVKKFKELFEDVVNSELYRYIYSYTFNGSFALDPTIAKICYHNTSIENKCLYHSIYFITYSNFILQNRNDLVLLDLTRIIDALLLHLKTNNLLIGKSTIHNISIKLLAHFTGSNFSSFCKKIAIMYIITKENSQEDQIIKSDLLCLESLILYHESNTNDILEILYISKQNNVTNNLIRLLYVLESKDFSVIEKIKVDFEKISSQEKVFYQWLISQKLSQFITLPIIVDKLINDRSSSLDLKEYFPLYSGGFNFATLQSIFLLFEKNCINDKPNFIVIFKTLMKGVILIKNKSSINYNLIENFWIRIVSVVMLVEYIELLSKINQFENHLVNGYKRELKNIINDETILEDINKILYYLNIECVLEDKKYIPIILYKYLENELNHLKLESILKELNGLEQLINFYRTRLIISTKTIYNLENQEKLELFNDICNIKSKPSLARQSLHIEHMIIKYMTYTNIHRSLSFDVLEELSIELDKNGCPDEFLNSINEGFIELLRFSMKDENIRRAISLKFRQRRKIKSGNLKYDSIQLAQFYILLADDLYSIEKTTFAKIFLEKAINAFEEYTGEVNSFYCVIEMKIFSIQDKIGTLSVKYKENKIKEFLTKEIYFNSDSSAIITIIRIAINNEIFINSKLIINVLSSLKFSTDWSAGYQWSILFCYLVSQMEAKHSLINNQNVDEILFVTLSNLRSSDQSQVDVDGLIDAIPILLYKLKYNERKNISSLLNQYLVDINEKKIEMIFTESMRSYLINGHFPKIIDAYFRVFKHDLFLLLDDDAKAFLSNSINTMNDYESGFEAFNKSKKTKDKLWIRIFLLKHLIAYAISCNSKELISQLTDEYKYFGYEYISSMLNQLINAPFIKDSTKEILNYHLSRYSSIIYDKKI